MELALAEQPVVYRITNDSKTGESALVKLLSGFLYDYCNSSGES